MIRGYGWFILLLIINLLLVAVYLIYGIFFRQNKEGRIQYVLNAVVMLLCPLAGIGYFVLGAFIQHVFLHREVDLADVVFSKERVRSLTRADEERERNMVPMEEALAVSDKASMRQLMLNVIRGDIRESLNSIALGLNSEDSETSHYAASVLRDELNDFRVTVQKLYEQVMQPEEEEIPEEGKMSEEEETPEELELRCQCAAELIHYMDQVLRQHVFTDLEQESFVSRLDEVCEFLYTKMPELMKSSFYEAVALRLIELRKYDRAEEWCQRSFGQYPEELSSYTCPLKLYFTSGERELFFATLEKLQRSTVVLDSETLELVRMFQK